MTRLKLSLVLLATWIALSAGLWVVASLNFRTVDRVLEPGRAPALEAHLPPRTAAEERPLLRFLASEINRALFRAWSMVQLVLAAGLLALVLSDPAVGLAGKVTASLASLLAVVLSLIIAPWIARIGPPLDFVSRPVPPEWEQAHRAFMRVHGAYMALDLAKVVLLTAALVAVFRVRDRSRWADMGPGG